MRRSSSWLPIGALLVLVVDLASKVLVVTHPRLSAGVVYNPDRSSLVTRLVICVGTVAVVAVLARLARGRGMGEVPVLWFAGGMLVGAVAAQGISVLVWRAGVPDFITLGGWVWNLADFSIGIGLLLTLVSSVAYAVRAAIRG